MIWCLGGVLSVASMHSSKTKQPGEGQTFSTFAPRGMANIHEDSFPVVIFTKLIDSFQNKCCIFLHIATAFRYLPKQYTSKVAVAHTCFVYPVLRVGRTAQRSLPVCSTRKK